MGYIRKHSITKDVTTNKKTLKHKEQDSKKSITKKKQISRQGYSNIVVTNNHIWRERGELIDSDAACLETFEL